AIALSLKEANQNREIIEIEDTPEDEEEVVSPEPSTQPPTNSSGTGPSSFLSERAQMEKERLARQKRLRPDTSTTSNGDDEDEDDELREPPAKRQQISRSYGVRADDNSASSSNQRGVEMPRQAPASVSTIDQLFWNGELRQTATQHGEPRKDGKPTFRLTEILGKKSELAFAIISSYSLDLSWIYGFFDRSAPVIVVAQPDSSGEASLKRLGYKTYHIAMSRYDMTQKPLKTFRLFYKEFFIHFMCSRRSEQ
ncbi:hypothetical protein C0995_005908, partial [Termitomyces sp. Mi166